MSLIADALKAAEAERRSQGRTTPEAVRRLMGGPAPRRTQAGAAAELLHRPLGFPRHVRVSAIILLLTALVSATLVALRPRAAPDEASGLAALSLTGAFVQVDGLAESPAETPGAAAADTAAQTTDDTVADTADETTAAQTTAAQTVAEATPDNADAGVAPAAGALAAAPTGDPQGDAGSLVSTPAPEAAPSERRQLTDQELRVDARTRRHEDLFADAVEAQRSRDFRRAIGLYGQILAEENDVEVLNNLGVSHQELGELEAARDAFRRAVSLQPRYAAAWSNLGVVLGALGRETEASTALAEALRLAPDNAGTRVNQALLYQRQGVTSEAKRILQEVLQLHPRLAEANFALAGILESERQDAAAVVHYRLFLETSGGRFPQLEPLVAARVRALEARL